jgi:hypothetical protein
MLAPMTAHEIYVEESSLVHIDKYQLDEKFYEDVRGAWPAHFGRYFDPSRKASHTSPE